MSRNVLHPDASRHATRHPDLVDQLADELRSHRTMGQPTINEEHFPTGAIRVSVFWDRWDEVPPDERATQIVAAYRAVEGEEFVRRIGLLDGLTFPEAYAQGLLPCQILVAHRLGDQVTVEECRQAMIQEGASILIDPVNPPLLFGAREQAEAAVERLTQRLPGSKPVWLINQSVGASLGLSWHTESEYV